MSAKYDDVLMAVVQQEGSIKGLLHAFFDFLHRKTDLYVVSENPKRSMGFAPGQAQNLVLKSFQSFPMKPLEEDQPKVADVAPRAKKEKEISERSHVVLTEEGKQVPVGNGGSTDKYTWTQSLQDLTVSIPIQKGTKSKDLNVKFTQSTLCVKMKGKDEPVVEGKFTGRIKVEDSLWSLESNEILVLSLEKAAPKTWWKSVLDGDAEIDTTKVDSTMRIDEYDPATQGAIRKVMYEQRHGIQPSGQNPEFPPGI